MRFPQPEEEIVGWGLNEGMTVEGRITHCFFENCRVNRKQTLSKLKEIHFPVTLIKPLCSLPLLLGMLTFFKGSGEDWKNLWVGN